MSLRERTLDISISMIGACLDVIYEQLRASGDIPVVGDVSAFCEFPMSRVNVDSEDSGAVLFNLFFELLSDFDPIDIQCLTFDRYLICFRSSSITSRCRLQRLGGLSIYFSVPSD